MKKLNNLVSDYKKTSENINNIEDAYDPKIQSLYKEINKLIEEKDSKLKPLFKSKEELRIEIASLDPENKTGHNISFSKHVLQISNKETVNKSEEILKKAIPMIPKLKGSYDEDKIFNWIKNNFGYDNLIQSHIDAIYDEFIRLNKYIAGM